MKTQSTQGNYSYALFQRKAPYQYLGSFKIVNWELIDGSEETDGLDVLNYSFGVQYPNGLMVVQDGHNKDNGISAAQNYKLVRWDSIAARFNPPLKL